MAKVSEFFPYWIRSSFYRWYSESISSRNGRDGFFYWKNELDLYKTELDNTDHIVTSMLYDLSFNLDTTITGIGVDMWMGFSASSGSTDYYIECDCFEYGLLSLIKIITQLEEQEN